MSSWTLEAGDKMFLNLPWSEFQGVEVIIIEAFGKSSWIRLPNDEKVFIPNRSLEYEPIAV